MKCLFLSDPKKSMMDLSVKLFNSELYNSASILADYFLQKNDFDNMQRIKLKIIIVRSFDHLNLHHRAYKYIEKNDYLLNYQCVRRIFYRMNSSIEPKNDYSNLLENKKLDIIRLPDGIIDPQSIELHLKGMTKTSVERKNCLVSSIKLDNSNLESLIVLKRESLLTEADFENLLNELKDEKLRNIFKKIISYDTDPLNVSFFAENVAFKLYNMKMKNQLVFMGMEMIEKYPEESTSFLVFGLSKVLQKRYNDAKITFYEAIKREKTLGILWIFLGIAYSNLREYDNAISSFEFSKQLMIGSFKPDFYLAFEYHKMSNINNANIFYLNSLRIKREPLVIIRYSALLIHFEYYSEAIQILQDVEVRIDDKNIYNLLLAYAFLFTGDLEKANSFLEKSKKDWRYFATKGYIFHLQSYSNEACEFYTNAIVHIGRSWILEDLLKHAIDLKESKAENHIYDYGTNLFESMNLKSLDFVPF